MKKLDIKDTVWSFSKLNAYTTCPYQWYNTYVNRAERLQNAFSQYGTLVHEVLENYAIDRKSGKNNIELWELCSMLEEDYDNRVTEDFPYNKYKDLAEDYKAKANLYFEDIAESDLIQKIENKQFAIVGVELEFIFDIPDGDTSHKCKGFIDLVVRDKADGRLIIIDHKSKAIKRLKSGKPVAKDVEDALRQMSMYAMAIHQQFDEYPKEIWINAFRVKDIIKEPFDISRGEESLTWAVNIIHRLSQDDKFYKIHKIDEDRRGFAINQADDELYSKGSSFFCLNLCNNRQSCGAKLDFNKEDIFGEEPRSMEEYLADKEMIDGELVKIFSLDDEEFE